MTRRYDRLVLLIGIVGAVIVCVCVVPSCFFGFVAMSVGGSDKGSPELAAEWKAELSRYRTPEEAVAANPDVVVLRFDSGEWVFGLCRNSHGMWKRGGGTVVVKDSRGQVRAFFGHVCGEGMLGANWSKGSLSRYYEETLTCEFDFREYPLP